MDFSMWLVRDLHAVSLEAVFILVALHGSKACSADPPLISASRLLT